MNAKLDEVEGDTGLDASVIGLVAVMSVADFTVSGLGLMRASSALVSGDPDPTARKRSEQETCVARCLPRRRWLQAT